jgi:hypothetical protein
MNSPDVLFRHELDYEQVTGRNDGLMVAMSPVTGQDGDQPSSSVYKGLLREHLAFEGGEGVVWAPTSQSAMIIKHGALISG